MATDRTPSRTPAIDRVRRAGATHVVHAYVAEERHGRARDTRPDYGREAATALGIDPDRLFKTLVVEVDGSRLVAAVVPVSRELDLRRVAALAGGRRAELASVADAERASGAVVGGISPLGMRSVLPTIVDASAIEQGRILVSAGRRGLQLELAATDLVTLTGAIVGEIARTS